MYVTANNFVTGVYRSNDSISNFKISIRLEKEKLSLASVHDDDRKIEERVFSWQEKVFSPFEAWYYKFAGNCHTPLEERYHEEVTRMWEDGPPTNKLFTYTDVDNYNEEEEVPGKVTSRAHPLYSSEDVAKESPVHVSTRHRRHMHSRRNIVDYHPSDAAQQKNRTLQSSSHSFHILADLSTANITGEIDWTGRSEYILCTVRWDSINGILAVTPDFSPDPYLVEVDEDSRSLYSYWVTHASSNMTKEEYEFEKELLGKLTDHQMSIRQLQIGSDFEMPPHGLLTVFVMGEIVSAENFEANQLCVNFFVELPKGWSCDVPEDLTGVTQSCRTDRDGVANFGFTFQLKLSLSLDLLQVEPETLPESPQMYLEVLSCDGWGHSCSEGYGSFKLPATPGPHKVTVATWRPEPVSITSQLTRFFLGGSPELLELTDSGVPCNFQDPVVSKYGLPTITSGDVTLQLSVVHQSRVLASQEEGSRARNSALMERLSASTLVSSVNTVLLAFRRARDRMLEARSSAQAT